RAQFCHRRCLVDQSSSAARCGAPAHAAVDVDEPAALVLLVFDPLGHRLSRRTSSVGPRGLILRAHHDAEFSRLWSAPVLSRSNARARSSAHSIPSSHFGAELDQHSYLCRRGRRGAGIPGGCPGNARLRSGNVQHPDPATAQPIKLTIRRFVREGHQYGQSPRHLRPRRLRAKSYLPRSGERGYLTSATSSRKVRTRATSSSRAAGLTLGYSIHAVCCAACSQAKYSSLVIRWTDTPAFSRRAMVLRS